MKIDLFKVKLALTSAAMVCFVVIVLAIIVWRLTEAGILELP